MENIACETGNLLNVLFNFMRVNSLIVPCQIYGQIVAMLFGLFLLGFMGKAVYGVVKYK
jgi:hypothetical protein